MRVLSLTWMLGLFITPLMLWGIDYNEFPVQVNQTVYSSLKPWQQYAYLHDVYSQLQLKIKEIKEVRQADMKIQELRSFIEEKGLEIQDLPLDPDELVYTSISSQYIHLILRFLSWLPINGSSEEQGNLKIAPEDLAQSVFWNEWESFPEVHPLSDEEPQEGVTHYIVSPLNLRLFAIELGDKDETLRVIREGDIPSYDELISKKVLLYHPLLAIRLFLKYKKLVDEWDENDKKCDNLISNCFDGNRMRVRINCLYSECPILTQCKLGDVSSKIKLFWGTYDAENKTLHNESEELLLRLLQQASLLFQANALRLVQEQSNADNISLDESELKFIDVIQEKTKMTYTTLIE
jgi:hypothetical protein